MIITIKDETWMKRQAVAGKAVSLALTSFCQRIKSKTKTSLKDIEQDSIEILKSLDCTPTFFNYKGFPGAVCLSVNKQLVHGIPTDYILQDGDVVSLDLGATFEGAIADAAFTCIYGNAKSQQHREVIILCQKSLNAGIKAVEMGRRFGAIGSSIFKTVRDSGFALVDQYGGHGIDYNSPHAAPFVSNKAHANEGARFQPYMSFAIEPMLVIGSSSVTKVLPDKWTVESKDIGSHFEHSVCINAEGVPVIMTEHGLNAEDFV